MIRIDSIWLATEPMDMRAGTETALARVIVMFDAAQLMSQVDTMDKKINRDQTVIEKLTHEIAQIKRLKLPSAASR